MGQANAANRVIARFDIECEESIESNKARHSIIAQRSAHHQIIRLRRIVRQRHRDVAILPRLEYRKFVEEREPCICDEIACLDMTQVCFSSQCSKKTIARGGAHQRYEFELCARSEIRDPRVGNPPLVIQTKGLELRKLAQNLEPVIGN